MYLGLAAGHKFVEAVRVLGENVDSRLRPSAHHPLLRQVDKTVAANLPENVRQLAQQIGALLVLARRHCY